MTSDLIGAVEKLTEAQRELLTRMSGERRGRMLVRIPSDIDTLATLTWTGLVSDVYEMHGGAIVATITDAGRALLHSIDSSKGG